MGYKAIAVLALVAAAVALFTLTPKVTANLQENSDAETQQSFRAWLTFHKKIYVSEGETVFRLARYRANYKFVKNHNKRFQLGLETY